MISLSYGERVLKLHNASRVALGLPRLSLDTNLSKDCLEWAKQGIQQGKFYHSGVPGENIAWRTPTTGSNDADEAERLFNQWLQEQSNFTNTKRFPDCIINKSGIEIGHYSQIVWRNSKALGVGFFKDNNWAYLVCRYTPAGNTLGEWTY